MLPASSWEPNAIRNQYDPGADPEWPWLMSGQSVFYFQIVTVTGHLLGCCKKNFKSSKDILLIKSGLQTVLWEASRGLWYHDKQAQIFYHSHMIIYFVDVTIHYQRFKCLLITLITLANKKLTLQPCRELSHFISLIIPMYMERKHYKTG